MFVINSSILFIQLTYYIFFKKILCMFYCKLVEKELKVGCMTVSVQYYYFYISLLCVFLTTLLIGWVGRTEKFWKSGSWWKSLGSTALHTAVYLTYLRYLINTFCIQIYPSFSRKNWTSQVLVGKASCQLIITIIFLWSRLV